MNTILFLTRESFRRASIRTKYETGEGKRNEKQSKDEMKKTITFSYFSIPIGVVGCYFVGKFFESTISEEEKKIENFISSMWLTVLFIF